MKTLSFHNVRIGRSPQSTLIALDSQLTPGAPDSGGPIELRPGLNLIVAPNGYGKSTLLQTIAGVLNPLQGEIKLGTAPLHPERDVLYVSEYLTFPKFIYPGEWIEYMADAQTGATALAPWIEKLSLTSQMKRYLGRLSQGERRKVTWLGAEASAKPILLLDEPLDGLDILAIRAARELLTRWKSQGRIICMVAHQLAEVLDLADEAYLIREQKLLPWSQLDSRPLAAVGAGEFREALLKFYG